MGLWRGIVFDTDSEQSALEHAEVGYAGFDPLYLSEHTAVLVTGDARLELHDSLIHHSGGAGVTVSSGGVLLESGNTFEDNQGGDLVQEP